MFATIRRHQKWLWGIIITVIIVSFVIFFSPNVNLTEARRGNLGTIYGRPITFEQYAQAYREAKLGYFIHNGSWPDENEARQTGFDIDRETRNRLFLIEQLKANQIYVNDDTVAKWIASLAFLQDRQKKVFQPAIYDYFVKNLMAQKGLTDRDFERFARHEVGIRELIAVYGTSGLLVTPREAEAMYRHEHEQFVAQVVYFQATNYLAAVTVNATNLAQFFTNRLAFYRIPERVQVSYVRFAMSNYWADAEQMMAKDTNMTQAINKAYEERGTNVFVDPDGKPLSEAAAKEKIRQEGRDNLALNTFARRKAGEFGNELFAQAPPLKAESLAKFSQAKGIEVKETEPFGKFEEVKGLNVLDTFNRSAFALSDEDPVSSAIVGEDAVYIIALKKKYPSEIPAYESILRKVTDDYRNARAGELARLAGMEFSQAVSNRLAKGGSFQAICQGAKVEPVSIPNFSLSTRSLSGGDERLDLAMLKDLAGNLTPGKASAFVPTREGGLLLYLSSVVPAEAALVKKELPVYLEEVRSSRQFQAFVEWATRQMRLANMTEPVRKTAAQ